MAETKKVETARPGARSGQAHELMVILPMKPGGAARLRAAVLAQGGLGYDQKDVDRVGSVHDFRTVFIDNDTRMIFASTFDGDWESYIDDFATFIPAQLDFQFQECEGYPGIHSPDVKDYIVKHQVTATIFYSAYPDLTVRDIWKAAKVKKAVDDLLDAAQ
jgi:hypothetical protein